MFFDNPHDIEKIAKRCGTTVFVLPGSVEVEIRGALRLEPAAGATTITIDQVREVMARLELKQKKDQFVVIRPAEALGLEAANAMLKALEEPGEMVHFLLVTSEPGRLLPTILSRANVFVYRAPIRDDILADKKVLDLAKRMVAAKGDDLVEIAEKIAGKKDAPRAFALEVLATAVEVLYKSYFITGRVAFLNKIPKFLAAYDSIEAGGHVKLHLVADLI